MRSIDSGLVGSDLVKSNPIAHDPEIGLDVPHMAKKDAITGIFEIVILTREKLVPSQCRS